MASAIVWHDVRETGVEGKGWTETEAWFDRLPAKAKGVVREVVWNLSRSATGMAVRFHTDAPQIRARWTLRNAMLNEANFPRAGFSGLDLYVHHQATWRWAGTTLNFDSQQAESDLMIDVPVQPRFCQINLPLRNPVESLEIGVPEGYSYTPVAPRTELPLVCYGTSIVHGAYASRPGMVHTSILARRVDLPHLNLGFSGNAQMEPEVAHLLAELKPRLFIIDPLPNMHRELVEERAETFMRILLARHPEVPMIMVEDRSNTNAWMRPDRQAAHEASRAAYRKVYEKLKAEGAHLWYVPGEGLFGTDAEASPDSSHPTDLGYMRMADILDPVLRDALGRS